MLAREKAEELVHACAETPRRRWDRGRKYQNSHLPLRASTRMPLSLHRIFHPSAVLWRHSSAGWQTLFNPGGTWPFPRSLSSQPRRSDRSLA